MTDRRVVRIEIFADILCIWAYCAQIRVAELENRFGDQIELVHRAMAVFGNTEQRIGHGWAARGGFDGFADHVADVAAQFDHVTIHPAIWRSVRPASSMGVHLILKAIQICEQIGAGVAVGAAAQAAQEFRRSFFEKGLDIAHRSVQKQIVKEVALSEAAIDAAIEDGRAFAALSADFEAQRLQHIEGSPTYVLNEGRQKLYGNVGYRVIEANVQELLRAPRPDQASWC